MKNKLPFRRGARRAIGKRKRLQSHAYLPLLASERRKGRKCFAIYSTRGKEGPALNSLFLLRWREGKGSLMYEEGRNALRGNLFSLLLEFLQRDMRRCVKRTRKKKTGFKDFFALAKPWGKREADAHSAKPGKEKEQSELLRLLNLFFYIRQRERGGKDCAGPTFFPQNCRGGGGGGARGSEGKKKTAQNKKKAIRRVSSIFPLVREGEGERLRGW